MSQTLECIDPVFITDQIRSSWNQWNFQQRSIWCLSHDLPVAQTDFDDLPTPVQDAIFCEYLDNAKKSFD